MPTPSSAASSAKTPLDAVNFFLADVRDGLGPYLAIYLLTVQKWDEASIGSVMTVAGIAGILAQGPAGAFVDKTTAKRALVIAAALIVTLVCAEAGQWRHGRRRDLLEGRDQPADLAQLEEEVRRSPAERSEAKKTGG